MAKSKVLEQKLAETDKKIIYLQQKGIKFSNL